jgi:hypothetical protein
MLYFLFSGFLAYFYFKAYFGSVLLPVQFDFAIIGLGLISFAKIIKEKKVKEFENDHGRQESINSGTDNLIFFDKIKEKKVKEFENDHGRQESINSGTDNLIFFDKIQRKNSQ